MAKFKKENSEEVENDALLNDEQKAEAPVEPAEAVEKKAPVASPKRSVTTEAQKVATDNVKATKERLERQPKVSFMLPLDPNDKANLPEEVTINGYKTIVPKGEVVEIPQAVYQMLITKYKISAQAGVGMKKERSKDVDEALS